MVVIVISGRPGSGKSTIAKAIAKKFKLRHFSAGDAMRELAVKMGFEPKGVGFMKFQSYVKDNPSIDRRIDELVRKQARRGGVVIDSWLAGQIIKKASLKLYIKVPLKESAKRTAKREGIRVNDALNLCEERENDNVIRWKELYGIDINDLNPYHIVFDTSIWSINEMNDIICYIVNRLIKKVKLK